GYREALINDDPWAGLLGSEAGRAGYEEANHRRFVLLTQVFVGMNCWLLGAFERAAKELSGTLREDVGLSTALRDFVLACVLVGRGGLGEGGAAATRMIEVGGTGAPTAYERKLYEGRGRWVRADVRLRQGHLDDALGEALAAIELLSPLPPERVAAEAT